jgi:hypothetical protein
LPGIVALMELLDSPTARTRGNFSLWLDPKRVSPEARRNHTYSKIQRNIFPEALILVLANIDRRQTIRLGRKWVKGRGGGKLRLRPVNLPWHDFIQWVRQETYKEASAILLGYAPSRQDPLHKPDEFDERKHGHGGVESSPLSLLLKREKLEDLLSALTPRKRELLEHLFGKPLSKSVSATRIRTFLAELRKISSLKSDS